MFKFLKKKQALSDNNIESVFTNDEFHKLYSLKYSVFIDYIVKRGINPETYQHRVSEFISEYFPDPISDISGIFRWIESASKDRNVFNLDIKTEFVRAKSKELFENLLSRMKQSGYIFIDTSVPLK